MPKPNKAQNLTKQRPTIERLSSLTFLEFSNFISQGKMTTSVTIETGKVDHHHPTSAGFASLKVDLHRCWDFYIYLSSVMGSFTPSPERFRSFQDMIKRMLHDLELANKEEFHQASIPSQGLADTPK